MPKNTHAINSIKTEIIALIKNEFANYSNHYPYTNQLKDLQAKILLAKDKTIFDKELNELYFFCKENKLEHLEKELFLLKIKFYNYAFYQEIGVKLAQELLNSAPDMKYSYLKDCDEEVLQSISGFGIAYVSGSGINTLGHALLFINGKSPGFVHIEHLYDYPRYMTMNQFSHYLRDNNKQFLAIQSFDNLNINYSIEKLRTLSKNKWWWKIIKDNCLSFCFEVVGAGGFDKNSYHSYDIPSVILDKTNIKNLTHFHLTTSFFKRVEFDPAVLQEESILDLPVAEKYSPEDIKRFLIYVLANLEKVREFQMAIIKNNKDTVSFESEESSQALVDKQIMSKLSEVLNKDFLINNIQMKKEESDTLADVLTSLRGHLASDITLFKEVLQKIRPRSYSPSLAM